MSLSMLLNLPTSGGIGPEKRFWFISSADRFCIADSSTGRLPVSMLPPSRSWVRVLQAFTPGGMLPMRRFDPRLKKMSFWCLHRCGGMLPVNRLSDKSSTDSVLLAPSKGGMAPWIWLSNSCRYSKQGRF
uniref:Uncharacterized protein n=1 Tax=Triticum urartu TaxID=4572 RepID=A0A8R7TG03_TRIUA